MAKKSKRAKSGRPDGGGAAAGGGAVAGASDSVKVAVRVRPFNQRELDRKAAMIVQMDGNTTTVTDPTGQKPARSFTFDYSYWSHDNYKAGKDGMYVGTKPQYADQQRVFDDLGRGMLDNAMVGYNAALFAYGQTGSGKSYSMVGYGANKGVVPMLCSDLFRRISSDSSGSEYQVTFSMLEIYNERVRDLLATQLRPGGLKVRQNQKKGFFVHGLTKVAVSNEQQIREFMEQGNVSRTTASTQMNATSSRSHMVVTLDLKQVKNKGSSASTTTTSEVHMVDLAGSERADTAGGNTDRLQEGCGINQSLSCLGNVISALADISAGKPNVRVPYRDSVLTKLLQNALGGNSRTVMISAISPAGINYEETLSTLRYADRAKQIFCKAVVNENPTDKLIRELKEQNAKLMQMIGQGGATAEQKDILAANQQDIDQFDSSWADQVAASQKRKVGREGPGSQDCFLENINEDPLLCGVIRHVITPGNCLVGRESGGSSKGYASQIALGGLSIQPEHARMVRDGETVTLEPLGSAQVLVNGKRLLKLTTLQHHDRIVLAPNHLYKFVACARQRTKDDRIIDFEFVQTEIAAAQGLTSIAGVGTSTCLTNPDLKVVRDDLIALLPMIAEANAISQELEKNVHFDLVVKTGASHNLTDKNKVVAVKVTDRSTKYVWLWPKSKFINRKYLMQELYELWVDGEPIETDQSKDPFWDPPEDIFLGSVYLYLQSLAYHLDIDDTLTLTDYQGQDQGKLHVGLCPCDATGRPVAEAPSYVGSPQELLGKRMDLLVKIPYARNIKWVQEDKSRGISCRFKFYTDTKMRYTKTILHEDNPNFDYSKQFTIKSVSHNFINYLEHNALVIEVWGKQGNGHPSGALLPMPVGPPGVPRNAGDEASMDHVLSETQWRTERVQLLQQIEDLKKELDFLSIEKGIMEKEMTRITLASQTFMQGADGMLPGDGPGQELPGLVHSFLREDHILRERLDELSQYEYRPSKPEMKSLKDALANQEKQVSTLHKELTSIVKAAKAVTDAIAKKPAGK